MATLIATAPRVLAVPGDATPAVLETVTAALRMLHEAHRIRLVEADDGADSVHTIGLTSTGTRDGTRRVHTVDHIELRSDRLEPVSRWVRRQRRHVPPGTVLVAHGRTAGRMLVESGLARGESVLCLPHVHPLHDDVHGFSPQARARVRRELGITPGTRLILGTAPDASRRTARGWAEAVQLRCPTGVLAGHLLPAGDDSWQIRLAGADVLSERFPCAHLFSAADLFVAAARALDAHCLGVDAAASGLPLVAVTTDAAAESVLASGNGHVVRPRSDQIARAVALQLNAGLPARHAPASPSPPEGVAEVARGLLGAYRRALSIPLRTRTASSHDGNALRIAFG
jgi:hypothetical protein